jgi:hypothetical protein
LVLLGISAAGQGCSLVYSGTSDIVGETKLALIHQQLHHRARQQADAAWEELSAAHSGVALSKDYERGFKDGYVRTVWWGPEEAPVIPPSGYWSAGYQSPEGHQAIADWAEGFRRGVSVALQSGAAMSLKLPSPGTGPAGAAEAAHLVPVPALVPGAPLPSKEIETLPLPRPAPATPLPVVPLLDHGGTSKATAPGPESSALKSRGKMETSDPVPSRAGSSPASAWAPNPAPVGQAAPAANDARQNKPGKEMEPLPSSAPLFVTLGRPG